MARLPRICLPGIPQHIIQRGNNRQICFCSEGDVAAYETQVNQLAERLANVVRAELADYF